MAIGDLGSGISGLSTLSKGMDALRRNIDSISASHAEEVPSKYIEKFESALQDFSNKMKYYERFERPLEAAAQAKAEASSISVASVKEISNETIAAPQREVSDAQAWNQSKYDKLFQRPQQILEELTAKSPEPAMASLPVSSDETIAAPQREVSDAQAWNQSKYHNLFVRPLEGVEIPGKTVPNTSVASSREVEVMSSEPVNRDNDAVGAANRIKYFERFERPLLSAVAFSKTPNAAMDSLRDYLFRE